MASIPLKRDKRLPHTMCQKSPIYQEPLKQFLYLNLGLLGLAVRNSGILLILPETPGPTKVNVDEKINN